MKPTRAQEAEARRLLVASGFEDLERADRDAPLSNAGKLHAVEETPEGHERLQQRIEDGAQYNDWARSVLHERRWKAATYNTESGPQLVSAATHRRMWAMHCDGVRLLVIAKTVGLSYHWVNEFVNGIKAGNQGTQGTELKWRKKRHERSAAYRVLSLDTGLRLAAALIQGLKPRDSCQSPSTR